MPSHYGSVRSRQRIYNIENMWPGKSNREVIKRLEQTHLELHFSFVRSKLLALLAFMHIIRVCVGVYSILIRNFISRNYHRVCVCVCVFGGHLANRSEMRISSRQQARRTN